MRPRVHIGAGTFDRVFGAADTSDAVTPSVALA
jgi:hypothetical protein